MRVYRLPIGQQILPVAAVFLVFGAIGVPGRSDQFHESLNQVNQAKQRWAQKYQKPNGSACLLSDLMNSGELKEFPACPRGTHVVVGKVGDQPQFN
jgi:hypothetical protein